MTFIVVTRISDLKRPEDINPKLMNIVNEQSIQEAQRHLVDPRPLGDAKVTTVQQQGETYLLHRQEFVGEPK